MGKLIWATLLFMIAVTLSYAKDAQFTGQTEGIDAFLPQAGQPKPVNQMIDMNSIKLRAKTQQEAGDKTATNPSGKDITNYGMARKSENQQKKAIKNEERIGNFTLPAIPDLPAVPALPGVKPAVKSTPAVPANKAQHVAPAKAEK